MTDETTLNYVNELQAYMVHVIKLNAEIERLRHDLERLREALEVATIEKHIEEKTNDRR